MEKVYSKIKEATLLHQIYRKSDLKNERVNLVDKNQFLQCAALALPKDKTFQAHKHIWKNVSHSKHIAQESWVVIQGKVRVFFYDVDDSLICESILEPGDASFTFEGGHNYMSMADDTLVYEYKTGPYEGIENDKHNII